MGSALLFPCRWDILIGGDLPETFVVSTRHVQGDSMPSIRARGLAVLALAAMAHLVPIDEARSQDPSVIFGGLLGGFAQAAMADSARREWSARPGYELECLRARGLSVNELAARGVTPSDGRVRKLILECREERLAALDPPAPDEQSAYNPKFKVDGMMLGQRVRRESNAYRSYDCRNSDQFQSFIWCRRSVNEQGRFGPQSSSLSILHSSDDRALYISKTIAPAFFMPGDIDREIARISQLVGLQPRIARSNRPGPVQGIIVIWGDASLQPIDAAAMEGLKADRPVRSGLMFDFLGNQRKSAREGFPVFQIGGGAGFLWGASYDRSGKGVLRTTVVDMNSVMGEPSPFVAQEKISESPSVALGYASDPADDEARRKAGIPAPAGVATSSATAPTSDKSPYPAASPSFD